MRPAVFFRLWLRLRLQNTAALLNPDSLTQPGTKAGGSHNDVYSEVIERVCDEQKVDVHRIDERSGPGLIVSDISRAIAESQFVIADISPVNANVYYEVGFAHALNKPTILLAEKGTELPFDVSPFRTLFYENTIAGKRKLEEGQHQ